MLKFVELVEKKCELGSITDSLLYRVQRIYKRIYFISSCSDLIVEIVPIEVRWMYRKRWVRIYGLETVKNGMLEFRLSNGKLNMIQVFLLNSSKIKCELEYFTSSCRVSIIDSWNRFWVCWSSLSMLKNVKLVWKDGRSSHKSVTFSHIVFCLKK